MEYIAVFIAAIFPGGLVAFDDDLLQSLPSFNALRIYCAGIWHNAVVGLPISPLFKFVLWIMRVLDLSFLYAVMCTLRVRFVSLACYVVSVLQTR